MLQQLAFVEGDSAGALRLAMAAQAVAKDLRLVERTLEQTFKLLAGSERWSDVDALLGPAHAMLTGLRRFAEGSKSARGGDTAVQRSSKRDSQSGGGTLLANLPLEHAIGTTMGLLAIAHFKQSRTSANSKLTPGERAAYLEASFNWVQQMLA